jgi:hypothetical protein
MAQIIVERTEGSLADRLSSYRVYIDGKHRGDLASQETGVFDVEVGTRTLKLCIDSYWSPPIKVAVLAKTRVVCTPNIAHAFGMLSMLSTGSWISVREEPETAQNLPEPAKAVTPTICAA